MNADRLDAIARLVAARRSRRAALGGGLGLAAAAALRPRAARATAQEATPVGAPEVMTSTDPHPSAGAPPKTEYLFVQPFASGTWAPKAGEDGVFTLTLFGAPAQTIYFSDRPERIFGLGPTSQFLEGLGFTPFNPPNAALVAQTADDGKQDILVIELFNPVYDEAAATLTYDALVLADYSDEGLAYAAAQQASYTMAESFGAGGLFVDGCSDDRGYCYRVINGQTVKVGDLSLPRCNPSTLNVFTCTLCGHSTDRYYGKLCSETFPGHCSYTCDGTGCRWDCYAKLYHASNW